MVSRRLNRPLAKIGPHVPIWIYEPKIAWRCRRCSTRQELGSAAVEFCTKFNVKGFEEVDGGKRVVVKSTATPLQLFCCTSCATIILRDALAEINIVESLGPGPYNVLKSM